MDDRLAVLLDDLARGQSLAGPDLVRARRRCAWLADASGEQLAEFLEAVAAMPRPLAEPADRLLGAALAAVAWPSKEAASADSSRLALLEPIVRLYGRLGKGSHARAQLLSWLARGSTPEELAAVAELLVNDPPENDTDVVLAMAPLLRRGEAAAATMFPRLLDALAHPQIAAPALDLANYLTRERLVPVHPAESHGGQLGKLLGEIVQSLARLEEQPDHGGLSPVELSRQVASQVALAVSLCDTLALIGDSAAVGKLHQAMGLGHRRLRTEAAAGLARLGDETGAAELVHLAEQPVARLRVLAYADELGLAERIDPAYRTPLARAEAELAVWLAEPTQFGIPPASLALFDKRRQFWPGFAEPVECFLFRFTYAVTVDGEGERSLANIGIAGPLVHALLADLADLPPDDIYAAYAGWQAEHAEIRQYDVARLSRSEKLEVERLVRRLRDAGYSAIEPQLMGYFFGDKALVAVAQREGLPGVAVADFQDLAFFPRRHSRRPLGPEEGYAIYKGRRLLKSFNR